MAFASFDPSRRSAPMAEINMVPLIDVMLVLLVIFMVTAPLLTHAVRVELPQASAQPLDTPVAERIDLAIDASGQLYWEGDALDREQVRTRLSQMALRDPQPEIIIRADAEVAYRHVAQALGDASQAGLSRIGFVSRPEPR